MSKSVVERIWARDPTIWTGSDEASWLGWLDEPGRMAEDVELLLQFADSVVDRIDAVVLLGMGGSSLAPEVIKRTFKQETFHVLDTTHPQAIRDLEATIDVSRTLFISASKSGSTLETRSHTDYFWERNPDGENWIAITDPGSAAGEPRARPVVCGRVLRRADDRGPLLGALVLRDRAGGADGRRRHRPARTRPGDGGGVPVRGGQSGARPRPLARRGLARGPGQDLHLPEHSRGAASASGPSS